MDHGLSSNCRMCNDASLFVILHNLEKPQEVTLGDGYVVQATVREAVVTEIEPPKSQKVKRCTLQDVLYFPSLSYNLIGVSTVTKSEISVKFNEYECHTQDENRTSIAS